ncbi:MAG TPA: glycosyltransferase family 1 protein [Solirubrobacteraceae bacterium]
MTGQRPRVAFDVTPVISGRTGIARYVTQLGAALERDGAALRRFAVGRRSFALPPGSRHIRVPTRIVERWWRSARWPPIERLVGGAELVHATGLLVPRTRLPLVATVHDVAAVRHPELHPVRHVEQQRAQLELLDSASVIVAVSQATADDLIHLGVAPERVVVARLGVTPLPAPEASPLGSAPAGGYLLTVGETSPRKGYPLLLEALSAVRTSVELVIAGPPAGDEERINTLIGELGLASRVHRVGAVTDGGLARLYGDATALCFPSVAEGFGLPVLEAMAAGLPVLAREIPVARELAGDTALLVAGDDPQAWTHAIERVVSEPALRQSMASAGRDRAAEFTWQRTAAATLEAYRLALGEPRAQPQTPGLSGEPR